MDAIDIERLAERWVQEWEVSADENRVRSKDPAKKHQGLGA